MPRDVVTTVYKFDELAESAKERARDWWRDGMEFAWSDEARDSIHAFCDQFGVELTEWSVGPFASYYWSANHDNSNFRGVKLRELERESYPTGYYLDACMSVAFYDKFKITGDAKHAFEHAVDVGFMVWREDMEYQLSNEHIDDLLIVNEYEFTELGELA